MRTMFSEVGQRLQRRWPDVARRCHWEATCLVGSPPCSGPVPRLPPAALHHRRRITSFSRKEWPLAPHEVHYHKNAGRAGAPGGAAETSESGTNFAQVVQWGLVMVGGATILTNAYEFSISPELYEQGWREKINVLMQDVGVRKPNTVKVKDLLLKERVYKHWSLYVPPQVLHEVLLDLPTQVAVSKRGLATYQQRVRQQRRARGSSLGPAMVPTDALIEYTELLDDSGISATFAKRSQVLSSWMRKANLKEHETLKQVFGSPGFRQLSVHEAEALLGTEAGSQQLLTQFKDAMWTWPLMVHGEGEQGAHGKCGLLVVGFGQGASGDEWVPVALSLSLLETRCSQVVFDMAGSLPHGIKYQSIKPAADYAVAAQPPDLREHKNDAARKAVATSK